MIADLMAVEECLRLIGERSSDQLLKRLKAICALFTILGWYFHGVSNGLQ
jgi:hypothetical protein